ncbi:hypothetical protein TWF694_007313 [Orbilia ellipsospora]|uniref:Uncharacterized protein n=1 Tax=Orbilia ellipsospora TaxID=2528407 RepID=A0AAV9XHC5_9PEZI
MSAPSGSSASAMADLGNLQDTTALSALLIACIALIVAFLQVFQQYLTSIQRDKCQNGAISGWSKFTKTRWDISKWRIRVKYTRLNLSPWELVRVRQLQERELLDWTDRQGLKHPRTTYGYFPIGKLDIHHGSSVMFTNHGPPHALSFWVLTLRQKFSWIWFVLTKRRACPRFARAGWANILTTLHICPDETLIVGYQDADVIPSAVDVPFQSTDLNTLGLLCFMLGLRNIQIDETTGSINAQSALMRVQTLDIPGVGQVIAMDGDFESLRKQVHLANSDELRALLMAATGNMCMGSLQLSIHFLEEKGALYALSNRWNQEMWNAYRIFLTSRYVLQGSNFDYGKVISPTTQATIYKQSGWENTVSWAPFWKETIGSATPTIIKYLAFLPFLPIWCAQPIEMYFSAYSDYLNRTRGSFMSNIGLDFIPIFERHPIIEHALAFQSIPFLRPDSEFLLSRDIGTPPNGSRTWISEPNVPVLRFWPDGEEVVKKALNFKAPLPVPSSVIRLLNGDNMSQVRTELMNYTSEAGIGCYTVESTIYLTLMLADARMQSLWCEIEGADFGPLSGFYTAKDLTPEEQAQIINEVRFHPSATLVDFLSLWLEICTRSDGVGDTADLQDTFVDIMNVWVADETMCTPLMDGYEAKDSPEHPVSEAFKIRADCTEDPRLRKIMMNIAQVTKQGEPKSRAQFVEWIREKEEGKREEMLKRLLPLMQLRVWLMHLSCQCCADSSMVCKTERKRGVDVRLI